MDIEGTRVRSLASVVAPGLADVVSGAFARRELREVGVTSERTGLGGVAGKIDSVVRGAGEFLGGGRVNQRFDDFDKAIRAVGPDELKVRYDAIEQGGDARASRLAMGTQTGEAVVKGLIESSSKSSESLLKGVSREVSEAVNVARKTIEADNALADKLSREVKENKEAMMIFLDGMWGQQDQIDAVRAGLIEARSADENDAEGWKLKRSGGLVRRMAAKVGGIIPGAKERISAVTKGPQETRREKVGTTLAGVEAYIKTVASNDEWDGLMASGVVGETDLATVSRLEGMERFLVARNEKTMDDFRKKRADWANGVVDTLETGFGPDMGATKLAIKTAILAENVYVGVVEAADGMSTVVFETGESLVAKLALEKLQSVMAAREVVAVRLKGAVGANDEKALVDGAKAMRGADQVAERALLRAARTQSAIERAGGGVGAFGGAVLTEAVDEVTGGVTENPTLRKLLGELAGREKSVGVAGGEVAPSSETKVAVDGSLSKLFSRVPENYVTKSGWDSFLAKTPFKIGERVASLLDFVNSGFGLDAKSSLVKALVDGSRRRFADEILGVAIRKDAEGNLVIDQGAGGLYGRMLQTAEVVGKDKKRIVSVEVNTRDGSESTSRLANAVLLAEAQKGYVEMEAKQMETRAKLDKFWTLLAGSLVAAGGAAALGESANYMNILGQHLSGSLEAQVHAWGAHIDQVKDALRLLAEQGTINAPDGQSDLIRQWAQSSGTSDLTWSQRYQAAWGAAKSAADLQVLASGVAHKTMSTLSGVMAVTAAALPFKSAIEGFFSKKTAFLKRTAEG